MGLEGKRPGRGNLVPALVLVSPFLILGMIALAALTFGAFTATLLSLFLFAAIALGIAALRTAAWFVVRMMAGGRRDARLPGPTPEETP